MGTASVELRRAELTRESHAGQKDGYFLPRYQSRPLPELPGRVYSWYEYE